MKQLFLLICIAMLSSVSFSKVLLPNGITSGEKEAYDELINQKLGITARDTTHQAPTFKVRTPAEFEPIEAVVLQWSYGEENGLHGFLVENIQNAGASVIIIIDSSSEQSSITLYLTSENINIDNVNFIIRGADSIWIRDYGPQIIYKFDGSKRAIVDWEYNRPRPNDDIVPETIAEFLGSDIYHADENSGNDQIIFCGGNFMTDGFGKAFSSKLVLNENGGENQETIDRVANIMHNYHGIDTHVQMEELPYDGIHHIDMHLKFLDEETLLVGEYPEGIADGPQIEANLQYVLDNFKTCYGSDYRVIRVSMPADVDGNYPNTYYASYLTYTNSLIVNNYVLVPHYNQVSDVINKQALDNYKQALPGYTVLSYDCDNIISRSGAIHCITHDINKEKVLRIDHKRVGLQNMSSAKELKFKMNVWPYESEIDSSFIFLKYPESENFQKFPMTKMNNDSNGFTYNPYLSEDGSYEYYIVSYRDSTVGYKPQNGYANGFLTFAVEEGASSIKGNNLPDRFVVGKPYPNPFNPVVNLDFFVNKNATVSFKVFNSTGQIVYNIKQSATKGINNIQFVGNNLNSGIYFYQISVQGKSEVKQGRMLLVK